MADIGGDMIAFEPVFQKRGNAPVVLGDEYPHAASLPWQHYSRTRFLWQASASAAVLFLKNIKFFGRNMKILFQ